MTSPYRRLELSILPDEFTITRMSSSAPLPDWATPASFFSVTRTAEELSIVCASQNVPEKLRTGLRWRVCKVRGPFGLSEVGVINALTAPLAEAKISIFVVSTFATDYLLVQTEQLEAAIHALERAGHKIYQAQTAF